MFRLIKISILTLAALVVSLGNSGMVQAAQLTPEQQEEQAIQKRSFSGQNDILYTSTECAPQAAGGTGTTAGGGPVGGCGGSAEENKKQIWDFLLGKGLSESAAAGIMGNMQQESGFMPTADNGKTMGFQDSTGKGCRGVVQWCHGRNSGLDDFAKQHGKSWDCLGLQLEYMWYEMTETEQGQVTASGEKLEIPLPDALNGKDFKAKGKYTDRSGPYAAAQIFHDYFERANTAKGEHLGRGDNADAIYKEMTGKNPGKFGGGSSGGSAAPSESSSANDKVSDSESAGDGACPTAGEDSGPVPGDCGGLVGEVEKMHKEGKLIMPQKPNQDKDLRNCTDGQVECGTDGGKGGVKKKFLQSFVTIIKAAPGPVTLWNMNTGHMCDGLNHPKGKAVDIPCGAGTTPIEVCKKMIDFAISNKGSLGLTEILWQQNYRCGDGVDCSVGGHDDHIHFGVGGA